MEHQRDSGTWQRSTDGPGCGRLVGLLRCCAALLFSLASTAAEAQPAPTPPTKAAIKPASAGLDAASPGGAKTDRAKPDGAKPDGAKPDTSKTIAADADAAPAKGPKANAMTAYQEAVNAFKYQDFDNAIKRLRALLYPRSDLEQAREWQAREYLGAALWWHDDKQASLDEFTALLVRNPQSHLDPTFYPPQMIKDYEGLRANLVRLGVIHADQKAAPPKRKPPALPPTALAWVPFGVGQLANDEPVRGTAFMVAEIALGATSAILYNMNAFDTEVSESRRAWQISTGVGFWLVAAWGIVDAVLQRRELTAQFGAASPTDAAVGP